MLKGAIASSGYSACCGLLLHHSCQWSSAPRGWHFPASPRERPAFRRVECRAPAVAPILVRQWRQPFLGVDRCHDVVIASGGLFLGPAAGPPPRGRPSLRREWRLSLSLGSIAATTSSSHLVRYCKRPSFRRVECRDRLQGRHCPSLVVRCHDVVILLVSHPSDASFWRHIA